MPGPLTELARSRSLHACYIYMLNICTFKDIGLLLFCYKNVQAGSKYKPYHHKKNLKPYVILCFVSPLDVTHILCNPLFRQVYVITNQSDCIPLQSSLVGSFSVRLSCVRYVAGLSTAIFSGTVAPNLLRVALNLIFISRQ